MFDFDIIHTVYSQSKVTLNISVDPVGDRPCTKLIFLGNLLTSVLKDTLIVLGFVQV